MHFISCIYLRMLSSHPKDNLVGINDLGKHFLFHKALYIIHYFLDLSTALNILIHNFKSSFIAGIVSSYRFRLHGMGSEMSYYLCSFMSETKSSTTISIWKIPWIRFSQFRMMLLWKMKKNQHSLVFWKLRIHWILSSLSHLSFPLLIFLSIFQCSYVY